MRTWMYVADLTNTKTLDGGLVARCAPGLPLLLREGMNVAFVPPVLDAPRNAVVESLTRASKGAFTVYFSGIDSVDTAEMLVGCRCLVLREEVADQVCEAYGSDWSGWSVFDEEQGYLGSVHGLEEMPGQTMLLVDTEAKQLLIPVVDAFISDIDEEERTIYVSLPGGFLDL